MWLLIGPSAAAETACNDIMDRFPLQRLISSTGTVSLERCSDALYNRVVFPRYLVATQQLPHQTFEFVIIKRLDHAIQIVILF